MKKQSGMNFEDFLCVLIIALYFCLCMVLVGTVLWMIGKAVIGCALS
jgi:hypothetical protein